MWLGAVRDEHDLYRFFSLITDIGTSGWILTICAVIGLALSIQKWSSDFFGVSGMSAVRKRLLIYEDVNFLFFTIALSGIAANLIKNSIGRARPKFLESLGEYHFDVFAFDSGFASFPSGHSTTFGAMAMGFALLLPKYRLIFLVLGLIGGLSRVMVGAHYISDVIAGLTFGAAFTFACAIYLARRNLMFRPESSGWLRRKR